MKKYVFFSILLSWLFIFSIADARTPVTTISPEPATIYQNNQSDLDFINKRTEESVQIQTVQVRGWDPKKKEVIVGPVIVGNDVPARIASISPETITSVDDLENFARSIIADDPNIKLIKLASGSTELDYQYSGKLLGIFPIKAWLRVFIDNNHRVKVKLPWYDIFLKKTVDLSLNENESDLSKLQLMNLQNELQEQAWSLQLLANILRTKHDTALNSIRNMK